MCSVTVFRTGEWGNFYFTRQIIRHEIIIKMIFKIVRVKQCGIVPAAFLALTAVAAGIKIRPVKCQFRKGVAFFWFEVFDSLAAFSTR
ncbi:hypothetical protein D5396_11660 [Rahnella inusitata]|uniref:Uncharacterized protein n=1 Tax=Rahnella inusitata TaxID=58169 RepID=A0ABX9P0K9_9GAMM|nr:hypothetical protein D5396_11660 [Rahnella inusitata]